MNTYALTRNYLIARQQILQREASDCYRRAQDNRATANSQQDWKNRAEFARMELDLVSQALAELPPADTTA